MKTGMIESVNLVTVVRSIIDCYFEKGRLGEFAGCMQHLFKL